MRNAMRAVKGCFGILALLSATWSHAADHYSFGVLPQRSATLTAQYWNPILEYASRKAGVTLSLKPARSAPESRDAAMQGEYDFIYSNHIFQPSVAKAGYRPILRPRELSISGQIIVLASSPIKSVKELENKTVGFPSVSAFIGYAVPMDYLVRQNIKVTPVFGGNQEGIMAQLKAGKVVAASVNSQVLAEFLSRDPAQIRALWESPSYFNLPISVHPRVPAKVVAAVTKAIDEMDENEEGLRILKASAAVVNQSPPYGFRSAKPTDYKNYTDFYRKTVVKDLQK